MTDNIPSLDLLDFTEGSTSAKNSFIEQIGKGFENYGFIAVKNHHLTDDLQNQLYKAAQSFFSLPTKVKEKYEYAKVRGQRGYIGKNKERAKGQTVADLKEFFHVGQELSPSDAMYNHFEKNIWVEETPELKETSLQTFQILEAVGFTLLRAIALYLNLEEDYFDKRATAGNSILRLIHYFPIEEKTNAVRAAAHGDINLITILMGATASGLEILRRDGTWIPVTALPNQLVVNVGDMLERLTNKKLPSTIHRVVNSPDAESSSRFSIPFFMHPRSDMSLACLESCITPDNPLHYSPISAGAFLEERIRELGF